jgi:hypothetical protein
MPRLTSGRAPPHVVQIYAVVASAAQHVDGAGGVDHRGVAISGSPWRMFRHPHPRCTCGTWKRRSHARRPTCTIHLCMYATPWCAGSCVVWSACVCTQTHSHKHASERAHTHTPAPRVRACVRMSVCEWGGVCARAWARAWARVRASVFVRSVCAC